MTNVVEKPPLVEPFTIEHSVDPDVSDSILVASWAFVLSLHCLTKDILFDLFLEHHWCENRLFPVHIPDIPDVTCSDLISNVQISLEATAPVKFEDGDLDRHLSEQNGRAKIRDLRSSPHTTTSRTNYAEPSFPPSDEPVWPLAVSCYREAKTAKLKLTSDTKLHSQSFSRVLLEQFRTAVTKLSLKDDTPLHQVELLRDFDLDSISKWIKPPDSFSKVSILHKQVEEQALRNPLSVAVGQTDTVMTYRELDKGATALAHHILGIIQPPGEIIGNVAVIFSKTAFAVLAMLAILKAGGAFVPIDPNSPPARTEKILTNAEISLILCSEDNHQNLQSLSCRTVVVTPRSIYQLKKTAKAASFFPLPSTQPSSPAYIMYTSGSTGQPKGIAISHASITTSLAALTRHFDISPSTRAIQFNAFTFDVSVADIWMTLAQGGRICMPTDHERFNLNEFISAERCNFVLVTPSVAALIDPDLAKTQLRVLATIGEAVKPSFLQRYAPSLSTHPVTSTNTNTHQDTSPPYRLLNTYGPTEASVIATSSSPIHISPSSSTSITIPQANNIGHALPSCSSFLVSPSNPHHLAPLHAPGEIALVGPALALGYLNDPEKTAQAFRCDLQWAKDPRFSAAFGVESTDERRVYLTGDLGRYVIPDEEKEQHAAEGHVAKSARKEGEIIFLRRKADAGYIKVNGLRVEPGEVEAAITAAATSDAGRQDNGHDESEKTLLDWPNTAVCAITRDDSERLAAFVPLLERRAGAATITPLSLSAQTRHLITTSLLTSLRAQLPSYMIPRLWVPVTRLPRSSSGKLDRGGLAGVLEGREVDGWEVA